MLSSIETNKIDLPQLLQSFQLDDQLFAIQDDANKNLLANRQQNIHQESINNYLNGVANSVQFQDSDLENLNLNKMDINSNFEENFEQLEQSELFDEEKNYFIQKKRSSQKRNRQTSFKHKQKIETLDTSKRKQKASREILKKSKREDQDKTVKKKAISKQKLKKTQDIQDQNFNTSQNINEGSFMWSLRAESQVLTIQKGIDKKLKHILQNEKEKTNDINLKDNTYLNINLEKLQNQFCYFKSAENFSQTMGQLLDSYYNQQQQNKDHQISFQFYSQLDKGSFGKVDLYFCEIENYFDDNSRDLQNTIQTKDFEKSKQDQTTLSTIKTASTLTFSKTYNLRSKKSLNTSQQLEFSTYNNDSSKNTSFLKDKESSKLSLLTDKIENKTQNVNQNTFSELKSNNNINFMPVAGKKFNNREEFIRELYIMQIVQRDCMPKLIGQDIDQQIIFLELGLCSLYDLKVDFDSKNIKFTDEFIYAVLLNIIKSIESLLSNYNTKEQILQSIFHSDIKPQNIILTVNKSQSDNNPDIKLLLIDYGGASCDLQDYWTYYTPAFVCPELWDRVIEGNQKKEILTWDQVRYAEVYSACRTVQYLIIEQDQLEYFKKENKQQFIKKYKKAYPKTCRIIELVYNLSKTSLINLDYQQIILNPKVKFSDFVNQKINFDCKRLYDISKFSKIIHSKK